LAAPRSSDAPHLEGQRSLSAGGRQPWAAAPPPRLRTRYRAQLRAISGSCRLPGKRL